jgi:hypothetical protein
MRTVDWFAYERQRVLTWQSLHEMSPGAISMLFGATTRRIVNFRG